MKNVTFNVDDEILAAARRYAAARSTSVNQLVRDYLAEVAQREERVRKARRRIRSLSNHATARIGRAEWAREDLYER